MKEQFKFNFAIDGEDEELMDNSDDIRTQQNTEQYRLGEEIPYSHYAVDNSVTYDIFELGENIKLLKVTKPIISNNINSTLKEEELYNLSEKQHSDLISGLYEGGFKVWECSLDLAKYIINNSNIWMPHTASSSVRVLELGCGHSLPCLAAMHAFYQFVTTHHNTSNMKMQAHVQDYNREVIESVTIPNFFLNLQSMKSCTNTYHDIINNIYPKFYAGDWGSLTDLFFNTNQEKYDLILTSETIYQPKYIPRLLNLIKRSLSSNGKCFVAAKTYYFGCGGGTIDFISYVQRDGQLSCTTVAKMDDGKSNVREIIMLEWIR